MSLSAAEKRLLGIEGWRYKMAHGRWPRREEIVRRAKPLTKRRAPDQRAELPRHRRGEAKLPLREIKARLSALKIDRGCADCGFNAHPAALDFDHVRGVKATNIASIHEPYWSIVAHEVAKCDVVCANCHRIRHATRRKHRA